MQIADIHPNNTYQSNCMDVGNDANGAKMLWFINSKGHAEITDENFEVGARFKGGRKEETNHMSAEVKNKVPKRTKKRHKMTFSNSLKKNSLEHNRFELTTNKSFEGKVVK